MGRPSSEIQQGLLYTTTHTIHKLLLGSFHHILGSKPQNPKMVGRTDESGGGKEKEEEQDGMSVHSPCKALPSSASSLSKVSIFFLFLALSLSTIYSLHVLRF